MENEINTVPGFCPQCASSEITLRIETKDYFKSQQNFNIFLCSKCGILFTWPVPDPEKIGYYYKSEQYFSHQREFTSFLGFLYNTIRKKTLLSKIRIIKKFYKSGLILDIGCGTGAFLALCRTKGYNVIGIEADEAARKIAIEKYSLTVGNSESLTQLTNDSVEIITFWHSLEHMFSPRTTLNECFRILKPNGLLAVALPNHNSWDAVFYNKFWAAWDTPRHLFHFNRKAITAMATNIGFKLVNCKPMFWDAYYISLLSEQYKNGKKNYASALLNGMLSNFKAAIGNKDYSSQLYLFRK